MLDLLGNKLTQGDRVICNIDVHNTPRKLAIGTLERISEKSLTFSYYRYASSTTTTRCIFQRDKYFDAKTNIWSCVVRA